MSELYYGAENLAASAWIDSAKYKAMYEQSIKDPDKFWGEQGKYLYWFKPYTKVKDASFEGDVHVRWFEDGVLNVSTNCIDRHLPARAAANRDYLGRR